MIDKSSEEELKARIDIVDIISNYIELKPSGANYKARCPFHGEKTPSFVVSPIKQIFHCFGCGKGGDAIEFVKEYEKLNYYEALEKIASILNFPLRYTKGERREDISKILNQVQKWYRDNLKDSKIALEYLKKRGVDSVLVDRFGIGYSKRSQDLLSFLNRNFISLNDAKEVGVVSSRDGRFYARLVERITFPIYTQTGKIVGFGGRTITNHSAKYINSPQTRFFNKSKILYGYHLAKEKIYKSREIIVCEGYLDVILLHQAGFENSVATLGTALTKEHIPLLKKGEPEVILAYDGDSAGVNAGFRASMLLSTHGIAGRVVLFPEGVDPADMVSKGEIESLKKLLSGGVSLIEFTIETIINSYDIKNPYQKEKAFNEVKAYLSQLSEIIRDEFIPFASTLLGISPVLFDSKFKKKGLVEFKKPPPVAIKSDRCSDIGVLTIFKTLIEKPDMLKILDGIDTDYIFNNYQDIYELILKRDLNNPRLLELSIDDCYKSLSEDEFKKEICSLLVKKYRNILKEIIHKDIPFSEKHYMIRKINTDIIPNLRRGKLPLDSFKDIDKLYK